MLRRRGSFAAERDQLMACLDGDCPHAVRDLCSSLLAQLDSAQPTIVFDVKDSRGNDLTAVTVTMDGQPFANGLNGAALPVDPGEDSFGFKVPWQAAVVRSLVIKEGEKARRLRVEIGAARP